MATPEQTNGTTAPAVPRLSFEELDPALAELLRPRVDRLGYLGEFFQATAHQPDALAAFYRFTDAVKGALGERMTEVIALTMATLTGNQYELHQHERLSVRLGYGRDWVATVERLAPDAVGDLTADDRDAQRLAMALFDDVGRSANPVLAEFADRHGPASAVAAMFVVGRYLVHGTIANALQLAPPVPSIFEDGFDG